MTPNAPPVRAREPGPLARLAPALCALLAVVLLGWAPPALEPPPVSAAGSASLAARTPAALPVAQPNDLVRPARADSPDRPLKPGLRAGDGGPSAIVSALAAPPSPQRPSNAAVARATPCVPAPARAFRARAPPALRA
jgi:hypothetical protein